jgi:hypothetical protein
MSMAASNDALLCQVLLAKLCSMNQFFDGGASGLHPSAFGGGCLCKPTVLMMLDGW